MEEKKEKGVKNNIPNPDYQSQDNKKTHESFDLQTIDAKIQEVASSGSKKDEPKLKVIKNDSFNTLFHRIEDYLDTHYNLRFNSLALDIEISKKDVKEWESCNENTLWVELQKKELKIGQSGLKAILKSDFVKKYNPLNEYFKNLPEWDKQTDFIAQYTDYVKLDKKEDKNQFRYHFKKWCVRAVKCALIDGYFNKQAFVLTDDGKGQNIGKSTWCRFLCPTVLSKYIAEDLGNNDKDTRILICKNFLINMDELAALSRKEINQLKSLFSKDQVNERLPYDSKNSILPRVASFIGSTNMSTFLHDETGSVRWLCFVVESINWKYNKEFNVNNLWAQAYYLANDKNYVAELTRADILDNELRNDKFQYLSSERELLNKYFDPSDSKDGEFKRSIDIVEFINNHSNIKVNPIQIGKALKANKFERSKLNGSYGYYVYLKVKH